MITDPSPLIRALIDAFLLLESAEPEEMDPDTAVRGMENMASSLLTLTPADQAALRAAIGQIADSEPDPAYQAFVRALPDMIGLS